MPTAIEVGEKVEARFGGGPQFHTGSIAAANDDGTYNIAYDDGDSEESVTRLRIRRPGDKKPKSGKVGMKCEARHGGGKVCYDGTITAVDDLGDYSIEYDDGDQEQHVAWDLIFVQCAPKKSKTTKKLLKAESPKGGPFPTTPPDPCRASRSTPRTHAITALTAAHPTPQTAPSSGRRRPVKKPSQGCASRFRRAGHLTRCWPG